MTCHACRHTDLGGCFFCTGERGLRPDLAAFFASDARPAPTPEFAAGFANAAAKGPIPPLDPRIAVIIDTLVWQRDMRMARKRGDQAAVDAILRRPLP